MSITFCLSGLVARSTTESGHRACPVKYRSPNRIDLTDAISNRLGHKHNQLHDWLGFQPNRFGILEYIMYTYRPNL